MKNIFLLTLPALVFSLIIAGCKRSDDSKERIYDIKGMVLAIDATKPSVKLAHQEIPDLGMKAMVMDFDVENPKVLEGLKPRDKVQGKFKADSGNFIITHLAKY